MILYLDASALVKRYVMESGTQEVIALIASAEVVVTSLVTRAEVAAALSRAVRLGVVKQDEGRRAQRSFSREWPDIARVPVSEGLVSRADTLAWEHALRGYDAVQLASALACQESIGQEIVLATFDRQLWEAAPRAGLHAWPNTLAS